MTDPLILPSQVSLRSVLWRALNQLWRWLLKRSKRDQPSAPIEPPVPELAPPEPVPAPEPTPPPGPEPWVLPSRAEVLASLRADIAPSVQEGADILGTWQWLGFDDETFASAAAAYRAVGHRLLRQRIVTWREAGRTPVEADLERLARFCEQTVRDGILPSLAWFAETAQSLRDAGRTGPPMDRCEVCAGPLELRCQHCDTAAVPHGGG